MESHPEMCELQCEGCIELFNATIDAQAHVSVCNSLLESWRSYMENALHSKFAIICISIKTKHLLQS